MACTPSPPVTTNLGGERRGEQRIGRYALLRKLATGGMAEVYLALQQSVAGFEKLVVVKRIRPELRDDEKFVQMFLHEARVAAMLSHPNIAHTIDVGCEDGDYYIALEHVHGADLRAIVRQMRIKRVEAFPLEHALTIITSICAGLSHAHERRDLDGFPLGLVHRDVSPQNVIVEYAGGVKIVDFGIAKSATAAMEKTAPGTLKGKLSYMSPEQACGRPVDARSDVFAVSVLLYELTTNRRLFKRESDYATLKMICQEAYPRPSWVKPGYLRGLEHIVMLGLQRDPDDRFQTARDLQSAIEELARDEKLLLGARGLSSFISGLFEAELAADRASLAAGGKLAEVRAHATQRIALTSTIETGRYGVVVSERPPKILASEPPKQAKTRRSRSIAVGAAVALVVAIAAVPMMRRRERAAIEATPPPAATATMAKPAEPRVTLVLESVPVGAHIEVDGAPRLDRTQATFTDLHRPRAAPRGDRAHARRVRPQGHDVRSRRRGAGAPLAHARPAHAEDPAPLIPRAKWQREPPGRPFVCTAECRATPTGRRPCWPPLGFSSAPRDA